nr:unknown [uncultured archaeon]AAU82369.1 hypothetical protein GZ17A3_31 [uncultured archaeon GZfos17A3]
MIGKSVLGSKASSGGFSWSTSNPNFSAASNIIPVAIARGMGSAYFSFFSSIFLILLPYPLRHPCLSRFPVPLRNIRSKGFYHAFRCSPLLPLLSHTLNTLHAQLSLLFCRLLLYQPFLPPFPSNPFPSPHPSLFLPSLLLLVLFVFNCI